MVGGSGKTEIKQSSLFDPQALSDPNLLLCPKQNFVDAAKIHKHKSETLLVPKHFLLIGSVL